MEISSDFSVCEFFLKKKEILENEKVFIDKPVLSIIRSIDDSTKSKLILSGTEDSGKKLTTLKYMDINDGLFVYFNMNKARYYQLASKKDKIEAYIESVIASKLLKILSDLGLNSQMLELGVNMPYIEGNVDILKNYKAGDLISSLLYRLKKITTRKIIFVVDKIDTLDKNTQQIISKYFDLFDQNIIISSDLVVYNDPKRRHDLFSKGYDIVNVDYAKDPEILIQIIDARIKYHNENPNCKLKLQPLEDMLDFDVIKKAAILADGNIRKILCMAKLVYSRCNIELNDPDAVGKYILNTLDRGNNIRSLTPVRNLYL